MTSSDMQGGSPAGKAPPGSPVYMYSYHGNNSPKQHTTNTCINPQSTILIRVALIPVANSNTTNKPGANSRTFILTDTAKLQGGSLMNAHSSQPYLIQASPVQDTAQGPLGVHECINGSISYHHGNCIIEHA